VLGLQETLPEKSSGRRKAKKRPGTGGREAGGKDHGFSPPRTEARGPSVYFINKHASDYGKIEEQKGKTCQSELPTEREENSHDHFTGWAEGRYTK